MSIASQQIRVQGRAHKAKPPIRPERDPGCTDAAGLAGGFFSFQQQRGFLA